jgi:two-component system LytT family response regulator
MPELDGFGVIAALAQRVGEEEEPYEMPAVVFVTAYDEYAIRAFDAHPIDYLLKPFSDERFEAALDTRRFVRVYRSAIVNIDVIEALQQDPQATTPSS